MEALSKDEDLVIKKAGKGGAIVVWSKDLYVKEAASQLNNTEFYQLLTHNPTESLKEELGRMLHQAKASGWISDPELRFLFNENPRMASFYMLPKIHKCLENSPGRPVISGNESLTEAVSKYIDHFIKPFLPSLPAYIQDTTDVLNKNRVLQDIGSESFLVTMDVEALYTNIDHQQGLAALRHFLSGRSEHEMPPTDFLLSLIEWTLTNNIFVFQDKIFKQTKGCAMGACYSPSYAGLYLGKWEEDFVLNQENNAFHKFIIWWGRYIDDKCLFWSGSETELIEFHGYLNSINPNIKLSLEYSKLCINFLDLTISKDNQGTLHASVYRKPTDNFTCQEFPSKLA